MQRGRSRLETVLTQPKIARVLFDEAHSEAWTIRPELAAEIQPAHPADSSLAAAAEALASRDFEVAAFADGPLDPKTLAGADVLVIAHPSDPKWEHTLDGDSPRLDDAEIEAIERFVEAGGGLIVLGETEQDKYGNNLNELLARFGLAVENATVQDYEHHREAPAWVLADLTIANGAAPDLLARVHEACFYRAGTVALGNGGRVIARTHETADPPGAPLAAITEHGAGRVAVLADSDLFGDDCIGDLDHAALWLNLVYWAAGPAFAASAGEPGPATEAVADPHWPALKAAVAELRLTQEPDGSVDLCQARPRPHRRADRDDRRRGRGAGPALPPPVGLLRRRSPPTSPPGWPRASASPTSTPPPTRSAPSATARTGSSTWSSSRCTSRTPPATPASRRCWSASPGPGSSPSWSRTATTTPSSSRSSWSTTPTATTPSARSSSRRPSPCRSAPRRTSARSSATARRSASAGSAAPPRRSSTSTCPPTRPACSARRSSPRTPTSPGT